MSGRNHYTEITNFCDERRFMPDGYAHFYRVIAAAKPKMCLTAAGYDENFRLK
ncbi:hypothetical protein [Bosea sp. (in: a-proteobacteria)]|uniref:hypothetical protein n=1 Tax=Bosea sp. (in: a-proteobacteria) TaxID=1871050 RepID=UPI0025C58D0F|nr:hypothetical protein [Bosea sp. (in: a-proteobacteria)]